MTDTLIALISILIGIIGAHLTAVFFEKHSLGATGNTIAGVFGGVFFIKSFGRLGFDPKSIMQYGAVDLSLFTLNSVVSFLGGGIAVILICKLKNKMNK